MRALPVICSRCRHEQEVPLPTDREFLKCEVCDHTVPMADRQFLDYASFQRHQTRHRAFVAGAFLVMAVAFGLTWMIFYQEITIKLVGFDPNPKSPFAGNEKEMLGDLLANPPVRGKIPDKDEEVRDQRRVVARAERALEVPDLPDEEYERLEQELLQERNRLMELEGELAALKAALRHDLRDLMYFWKTPARNFLKKPEVFPQGLPPRKTSPADPSPLEWMPADVREHRVSWRYLPLLDLSPGEASAYLGNLPPEVSANYLAENPSGLRTQQKLNEIWDVLRHPIRLCVAVGIVFGLLAASFSLHRHKNTPSHFAWLFLGFAVPPLLLAVILWVEHGRQRVAILKDNAAVFEAAKEAHTKKVQIPGVGGAVTAAAAPTPSLPRGYRLFPRHAWSEKQILGVRRLFVDQARSYVPIVCWVLILYFLPFKRTRDLNVIFVLLVLLAGVDLACKVSEKAYLIAAVPGEEGGEAAAAPAAPKGEHTLAAVKPEFRGPEGRKKIDDLLQTLHYGTFGFLFKPYRSPGGELENELDLGSAQIVAFGTDYGAPGTAGTAFGLLGLFALLHEFYRRRHYF